jgi:hypothetical protein
VDGGIGAPRINRSLSQILSLKNNPETINQKEAKFTQPRNQKQKRSKIYTNPETKNRKEAKFTQTQKPKTEKQH